MLHRPYGPRGAESEDPEFWTDLTRDSDFLPEPGIVNPVLRSAQEPYTPADAHQDRQTIDDEPSLRAVFDQLWVQIQTEITTANDENTPS